MMIETGLAGAAVVALGLVARAIGVNVCLVGSGMNSGTRAFVTAAYLPKATVQAAIGATPLLALSHAGLPTKPGEIILAVAVLSIVLTAPLGAWATAFLGERHLEDNDALREASPISH
ncbi:MAG TPA: hypothetical protein ENN29_11740 [Candidatus Hydrogenedentes bacterium]|nr:hypothetical protein [Candidatus Hydrogenedentota bacterium]